MQIGSPQILRRESPIVLHEEPSAQRASHQCVPAATKRMDAPIEKTFAPIFFDFGVFTGSAQAPAFNVASSAAQRVAKRSFQYTCGVRSLDVETRSLRAYIIGLEVNNLSNLSVAASGFTMTCPASLATASAHHDMFHSDSQSPHDKPMFAEALPSRLLKPAFRHFHATFDHRSVRRGNMPF